MRTTFSLHLALLLVTVIVYSSGTSFNFCFQILAGKHMEIYLNFLPFFDGLTFVVYRFFKYNKAIKNILAFRVTKYKYTMISGNRIFSKYLIPSFVINEIKCITGFKYLSIKKYNSANLCRYHLTSLSRVAVDKSTSKLALPNISHVYNSLDCQFMKCNREHRRWRREVSFLLLCLGFSALCPVKVFADSENDDTSLMYGMSDRNEGQAQDGAVHDNPSQSSSKESNATITPGQSGSAESSVTIDPADGSEDTENQEDLSRSAFSPVVDTEDFMVSSPIEVTRL